MDLLKGMGCGAVLTLCVAIVVGSQGSSGGQLAVYPITIGDLKFFWSWPLFFSGSGISWGILLLQR